MLSAHHKDDQAETLLLNLMRGSGPSGFGRHWRDSAVRTRVGWCVLCSTYPKPTCVIMLTCMTSLGLDDPSNEDRQFDRNYLRHEILPRLEERWPEVSDRLRQSAVLAREAATMLDQLADDDLQALADRPDRLSLDALRALPSERQRNVIRYVVIRARDCLHRPQRNCAASRPTCCRPAKTPNRWCIGRVPRCVATATRFMCCPRTNSARSPDTALGQMT